jgi:hypothetical protein
MQVLDRIPRFQALWLQLKSLLVILYTYKYTGHADELFGGFGGC